MIYHILIVDDESAIKKGISLLIQKIAPNCVVDATASDGAEAIEIIKKTPPDIVITDIKMPVCNGLELSRFLYHNHPEIKIIMLTGFADFEYAQAAIKYRICDFLLKPTSKDKLFEALTKAQKEIREAREKSGILKQNTALLRERFLQEIAAGLSLSELTDKQSAYFPKPIEQFFCVAVKYSSINSLERNSIRHIRSILEQQLEEEYIFRYNDTISCLYLVDTATDSALEQVTAFAQDIINLSQMLYGIPIITGISTMKTGLRALPAASTEALDALLSTFFTDRSICIYSNQPIPKQTTNKENYGVSLYGIESVIENQEFDHAEALIKALFADFQVQSVTPAQVRYVSGQIYYILCRTLIRKELQEMDSSFLAMLEQCSTSIALETVLLKMLNDVAQKVIESNKHMNHIIKKAIFYIRSHLSENLSLEVISEAVNSNPSYLSRIFKKECGETLTEYITQMRIEKAKELLRMPDQLIYQVSEAVGFNDPAYFSTTFKKLTGVAPKDFKMQTKK